MLKPDIYLLIENISMGPGFDVIVKYLCILFYLFLKNSAGMVGNNLRTEAQASQMQCHNFNPWYYMGCSELG